MAAEGDNIVRFTYTGADDEWIDGEATHIFVQARVIRARAFRHHPNIVEVICHDSVEKIEERAFLYCPRLRRVIMPGVTIVEQKAFHSCVALEDVECGKLEIIKKDAFYLCVSLRSINLPSARIVQEEAFFSDWALAVVAFGSKLERIEERAFSLSHRLEQIAIPLKDGLFSDDSIFTECNLNRVDLVEGELHETIAALHLEEWRNEMNEEIDSINQILPDSYAGFSCVVDEDDEEADPTWDNGDKAQAIRSWIRSVLRKITQYQAEHRRLLEEDVATTLQLVLSNADVVMNNVLPFLQLPSYTFEVGGDHQDARRLNVDSLRIEDSDEEEE